MIDNHDKHENRLSRFSNVQNLIEEKNISIFKEANKVLKNLSFNFKKC